MYPLSLLVFCKAEREDEQESMVVSIAKNTKYLGKTLVAAPQLCFLEVFTRETTSLNKSLDVTNVAFNELTINVLSKGLYENHSSFKFDSFGH